MELQPHGVAVRIAYPPNMRTPGYEEELKMTPAEVQDITDASGDTVFAPQDVALSILKGTACHITVTIDAHLYDRDETESIPSALSRSSADAQSIGHGRTEPCSLLSATPGPDQFLLHHCFCLFRLDV